MNYVVPGVYMKDSELAAQETRNQQELINSDLLPVDGSEHPAFARMGIVWGADAAGDALFRHAALPAGWKLAATAHVRWSDLLDDKGNVRAHVFYQAVPYDKRADIVPARRFHVLVDDSTGTFGRVISARVVDMRNGRHVLHETDSVAVPVKDWEAESQVRNAQRAKCEQWLEEHFPQWRDPSAHWND